MTIRQTLNFDKKTLKLMQNRKSKNLFRAFHLNLRPHYHFMTLDVVTQESQGKIYLATKATRKSHPLVLSYAWGILAQMPAAERRSTTIRGF